MDGGGGGADGAATDSGPRPDVFVPVDSGTDAGPVDRVGLCEACDRDLQCGDLARCGPLSGGERVCLRLCEPEFNVCPRGFECAAYAPLDFETVCLPIGEVCCIDEDADGYGGGAQCLGPDCDDDDMNRHPDRPELCDGGDQDCDDAVDEMFVDCAEAGCETAGAGSFQEVAAGGCADGACVPPVETSCGDYACEGGLDEGDVCADICNPEGADDDLFCAAPAHCDDGGCEPDYPDGDACDEDSDCVSGNCENGYCCGMGLTCCNMDSDCPGFPGEGTVCDTPASCQGSRGMVSCNTTTFACETRSGVPDDSACDSDVVAATCGTFADIACTGEVDQPTPVCSTSCTVDEECDASAHCDLNFCFPDLPDGEACDEPSDCVSGHCQNGFCCMGGDCCRSAGDCDGYGSPAVCEDTRGCEGTRDAAICVDSICDTAVDTPDDSACTSSVVADECGLYPAVRCTGGPMQSAPACPDTCAGDSECDDAGHCDDNRCVPDVPNGMACDEPSDCVSGHCQNGFCCAGGDCCATAADCPPATYGRPSECVSPGSCQGSRRDPVCTAAFTCQLGDLADDDSGCFGIESNDCALYPAVECTNMEAQTSDQMSLCDMSCTDSMECDSGAFCNGSMDCQSEGMPGDACTSSGECSGSLSCVDGVCCNSACTGSCEACNVAGSLGTCTAIPSGDDPAGECGGIDCGSYFAGFSGDACYERADAPASAVSCNGARACESAADVCPMQGVGDLRSVCDATCQDPRAGTCTGTTPPVCDNLDLGNHSCGLGQCARTVAVCVGGAPNACVPGSASTESCNDLDDDCDGVADNNITGSSVSAYEPNDACGELAALPEVLTDGTSAERTESVDAQIYYDGDLDYYSIHVREAGGADCITTCFDNERARLDITLTVPPGAGSYEICAVRNSCSNLATTSNCLVVAGGTSDTLTALGDSACCSGIFCSTNNSETFYVRVRGLASQAWECQGYELDYTGDEAC